MAMTPVVVRPKNRKKNDVTIHRKRKKSPTHHLLPKEFKLSSREGFGENIRPVLGGVDFLDFQCTRGDLVSEMVPFDADVLCPWSVLFRVHGDFQTPCVVFVDD